MHRIGQTAQVVRVEYWLGADTIDELLWPLLQRKAAVIGLAIGGSPTSGLAVNEVRSSDQAVHRTSRFFAAAGGEAAAPSAAASCAASRDGGAATSAVGEADDSLLEELDLLDGEEQRGRADEHEHEVDEEQPSVDVLSDEDAGP